jgi:hypothetical protein
MSILGTMRCVRPDLVVHERFMLAHLKKYRFIVLSVCVLGSSSQLTKVPERITLVIDSQSSAEAGGSTKKE